MKPRYIEYNAELADEAFDELPQPGDEIEEGMLITRVDIINQSKLVLKLTPKREVRRFDDFADPSVDWKELPKRFLEQNKDTGFVDKQSLNIHGND